MSDSGEGKLVSQMLEAAIVLAEVAELPTYATIQRWRAALAEKPAERPRAQQILESLTPGGSEFAGDPDACAAYVHKKISTLQDIAKNAVKARMAAQAERPQLSAVGSFAKEICDEFCGGSETVQEIIEAKLLALLTGEAEKVPPDPLDDNYQTWLAHNAPAAPPVLQAEPRQVCLDGCYQIVGQPTRHRIDCPNICSPYLTVRVADSPVSGREKD